MGDTKSSYTKIVDNRKYAIHVLDPKEDRRDNVRITLRSDDGKEVHHHLRSYEVVRFVAALNQALAYGPDIPEY
jgi:hypothetical protein